MQTKGRQAEGIDVGMNSGGDEVAILREGYGVGGGNVSIQLECGFHPDMHLVWRHEIVDGGGSCCMHHHQADSLLLHESSLAMLPVAQDIRSDGIEHVGSRHGLAIRRINHGHRRVVTRHGPSHEVPQLYISKQGDGGGRANGDAGRANARDARGLCNRAALDGRCPVTESHLSVRAVAVVMARHATRSMRGTWRNSAILIRHSARACSMSKNGKNQWSCKGPGNLGQFGASAAADEDRHPIVSKTMLLWVRADCIVGAALANYATAAATIQDPKIDPDASCNFNLHAYGACWQTDDVVALAYAEAHGQLASVPTALGNQGGGLKLVARAGGLRVRLIAATQALEGIRTALWRRPMRRRVEKQ